MFSKHYNKAFLVKIKIMNEINCYKKTELFKKLYCFCKSINRFCKTVKINIIIRFLPSLFRFKNIKIKSLKNDCFTKYFIFYIKNFILKNHKKNFKNLKRFLAKKSFIVVFRKRFDISYKNKKRNKKIDSFKKI